MPEYLVCETGPMGGASIVFVCNAHWQAKKWIKEKNKKDPEREFFVYMWCERMPWLN